MNNKKKTVNLTEHSNVNLPHYPSEYEIKFSVQ